MIYNRRNRSTFYLYTKTSINIFMPSLTIHTQAGNSNSLNSVIEQNSPVHPLTQEFCWELRKITSLREMPRFNCDRDASGDPLWKETCRIINEFNICRMFKNDLIRWWDDLDVDDTQGTEEELATHTALFNYDKKAKELEAQWQALREKLAAV